MPRLNLRVDEVQEFAEPNAFDPQLELTIWSSLLLDESEEDIGSWLMERYGDVMKLNQEIGFTPIEQVVKIRDTPSFHSRNRTNVRKWHWSDQKSLRFNNMNRDRLRGKAHAK